MIRHGYFRATPPLSEVEWAVVRMCQESGRALDGEIVLTRLLIRMVLDYLTESELPLGENLNSMRLIIRNVRTVALLLLRRKELEGPGGGVERVERELEIDIALKVKRKFEI